MKLAGRLEAWLSSPRAPWVVLAIAIALAAPALTATFTADDHVQRIVAREDTGIPGLPSMPLDRFVFANGTVETSTVLRDVGMYPWYVDPQLKLAFWRPISSATHAVDTALWPENATAQLAHNLVWHALGLLLVWLLYRRLFGSNLHVETPNAASGVGAARWIAVLALALYALDDARGPVVGWIANRNALVALALSLPALIAHDRWRRDGWAPGRWLAPLVFALSLGAGESALAITAYIGAHALCLDRAPWKSRLLALAPYVLIVVAWRIAYAKLGYGVAGSGVYLDPAAQPIEFIQAAITRVPFLVAAQVASLWADFASFYPIAGVLAPMFAVACALVAAVGAAAARILRRDPLARFFALGMVLAALPVASTFPADRLLPFIGIGGAGLVAQLIAAALRDRDQLGDGRARRTFGVAVALFCALVGLVISPLLLVVRSRSMVAVASVIDRANLTVPSDPAITTKTVILVTTPSEALAAYVPIMRSSLRTPRPAQLVWLAVGSSDVTLERVDDRTVRVTSQRGLLEYEIDQMMRSARTRPFRVGTKIDMANVTFTVEVVTTEGRPQTFTARFSTPLDDESLVWLAWRDRGYVPYMPPAVGARETFPRIDFLKLLE